jgi:mannose-6-phosphate isomerase-like protein (cupin superfamily)
MPMIDFDLQAKNLATTWKSSVVGQVGPARIKVLRMDEQGYAEETHDYNEGLLVISGQLKLQINGEAVEVHPGQMYLAEAGVSHAVLPGSTGTLVIIDV